MGGEQGFILVFETLRSRILPGRFQPSIQFVTIDVEMLSLFYNRNIVFLDLVIKGRQRHFKIVASLLYGHGNVRVLFGFVLLGKFLRKQVFHTCDSVA